MSGRNKSLSVDLQRTYQSKTRPLTIGKERFNNGYRDDNYHREFVREAIRVEREIFYAEEKFTSSMIRPTMKRIHQEEPSEGKGREETSSTSLAGGLLSFAWTLIPWSCSRVQRNNSTPGPERAVAPKLRTMSSVRVDRNKLDKILVAACEYFEGMKSDEQITKVKLLLEANADINTTQGVGLWKTPLIARMLDSKNERLREELINLADLSSLEPSVDVGESLLTRACGNTQFNTIYRLLKSKCEPNRIEKSGMTPLIKLCLFRYEDEDEERLRCIELLVNFEGEHAKTLKKRWINIWSKLTTYHMDPAPWNIVANFCIPNINVRPKFKNFVGSQSASVCLSDYRNSQNFQDKAQKLIGYHFRDARYQKEKYWPETKDDYVKMFKPSWG